MYCADSCHTPPVLTPNHAKSLKPCCAQPHVCVTVLNTQNSGAADTLPDGIDACLRNTETVYD